MLQTCRRRRHPEVLARVTKIDALNWASMLGARGLRDLRAERALLDRTGQEDVDARGSPGALTVGPDRGARPRVVRPRQRRPSGGGRATRLPAPRVRKARAAAPRAAALGHQADA